DWEPRAALDGGDDGLDCYRQIAAQCGPLLNDRGVLMCEFGQGQFADLRAIFSSAGWEIQPVRRDFAGTERVLCARFLG
ncbi:MAG TPA: hypothetical protein VF719_12865, partial [Abditibacteriaceae bacterium]